MNSKKQKEDDLRFMAMALEEAAKGVGKTSPNPAVGALVVKGNRVFGRGYHRKAGSAHAEVVALKEAGRKAVGACLYTTLEPCNHHGKTPPCTDAILAAGIARVVFASRDPNPLVNGSGIKRLRRAGVTVVGDILRTEADALNRPFMKVIRTGLPYVTLKAAISLDGKIATASGDSRWISGEASRKHVHQLRSHVDAVVIGRGTAQKDNPLLTVRLPGKHRNPVRVVVDSKLALPLSLDVFNTLGDALTWVATVEPENHPQAMALKKRGVDVFSLPARGDKVDLDALLRQLARKGLSNILVEGGATLATEFIRAQLVDELWLYIAPKLIGSTGLSWLGALDVDSMKQVTTARRLTAVPSGQDILLKIEF